jgi:hypothetical protein
MGNNELRSPSKRIRIVLRADWSSKDPNADWSSKGELAADWSS